MTLYTRIGDIPPFECFVKKEFLRAQEDGFGEYEAANIVGIVIRKDMAICVTAHLESGALWYELPLHAITTKKGSENHPIGFHQMWDCLSDQFTVHRYNHLRHLDVDVLVNDGSRKLMRGAYMFTIDFINSFYADHPSEHKTMNVIELETGDIVAYPNNRCLFIDKTFTKITGRPNYNQTNQHYFAEVWEGEVSGNFSYEVKV
jgi:hypothetical protein